jgi:hypothetical protein
LFLDETAGRTAETAEKRKRETERRKEEERKGGKVTIVNGVPPMGDVSAERILPHS